MSAKKRRGRPKRARSYLSFVPSDVSDGVSRHCFTPSDVSDGVSRHCFVSSDVSDGVLRHYLSRRTSPTAFRGTVLSRRTSPTVFRGTVLPRRTSPTAFPDTVEGVPKRFSLLGTPSFCYRQSSITLFSSGDARAHNRWSCVGDVPGSLPMS